MTHVAYYWAVLVGGTRWRRELLQPEIQEKVIPQSRSLASQLEETANSWALLWERTWPLGATDRQCGPVREANGGREGAEAGRATGQAFGRALEAKFRSWDSILGATGEHWREASGEHYDLI